MSKRCCPGAVPDGRAIRVLGDRISPNVAAHGMEVALVDDGPFTRGFRSASSSYGRTFRVRSASLIPHVCEALRAEGVPGDPSFSTWSSCKVHPDERPSTRQTAGVAGHVVDAVALGMETVGYELLAGATLTTAAATAGMGAGHHVAGSGFDTAGATTVGSGFHRAGDALYAVARKNFALAGDAARSALDSFVGPPRTQVDVGVSHPLNPPGQQPPD